MSPRKSDLPKKDPFELIEAVVCRDVGRGTQKLIEATKGDLAAAARLLARARSVGMVTGFFVPRGDVAAPETDGPVGTALLAAALAACGLDVRIAVDTPCAGAVRAAVAATGAAVTIDEVALEVGVAAVAEAWKWAEVDLAVSIERCGRSADGKPRNMRGVDVSPWTAPLDDLFVRGGWRRVAVGDGGNEIGMGKLPRALIAESVPNGAAIASVTSCDYLVVAGVSNWGAYGLMAALAVVRPQWRDAIAPFLTAERDLAVTTAVVAVGGVDGVTAKAEATVDGYGPDVHGPLVEELRRIACGEVRD
jgi:hypothetical protein